LLNPEAELRGETMTLFRSLGARRFALLAVLFVIAVACAKVDRGYYEEGSSGAGNGGASTAGNGGRAGSGTAGKAGSSGSSSGGDAGSAGEPSEAGSAGETFGGAGTGGASSGSLTVVFAGDGKGVVKSDVPGLDCNATCTAEFDPETQVVLTATPNANSTFRGWSGGGCTGTSTCTTLISEMTQVTATFLAKPKLTVTLGGNGAGVVKSVPEGIDCGATCSVQLTPGSSVQLVATPATGSVFSGWSGGGCSGTAGCTTTVNDSTNVTATFTLTTPTLSVLKTGTGLGAVTSAPMGINCGSECSQAVNYGTVVTLTAAATVGSAFTGWTGGGCSGSGACVVTVTAATQVTATFSCLPGTTNINYSGAIVTFTAPACVTSLTIDTYGAQGGNAGIYTGGYGARMKGTFAVSGGPTLKVLVGGKGLDSTDSGQQAGGSGGGGTFVTTAANVAWLVAGGGGGAVNSGGTYAGAGMNASIGTSGTTDSAGLRAGGINGNGGTTGSNFNGYHPGTAGGGLLSNGVGNSDGSTTSYGTPYTPGFAFINGGGGGQPGTCVGAAAGCLPGRAGGFGGGGAGAYMGGGGGGYSGGASGSYPAAMTYTGYLGGGGGGGSYNIGTSQTNVASARAGNGLVIITY